MMNILTILAWKNLKRNKKRTIATIVGIVVSVALVSFIFTLVYSFQESMLEATKSNIGNYHIYIDQISTKDAMSFRQVQNKIETIGISQTIGISNYETQLYEKQEVIIDGYDETSLHNRGINLIEGRLPENEKELLISNYLTSNLNETVKIGDKLTLEVQKVKLIISDDGLQEILEPDGVETIEYTITGIMKQIRKEVGKTNSYIAITKLEQTVENRPCEVTLLLQNSKEENIFYQELINSKLKYHVSENAQLLLWQGADNGINEKSQLELIGIIAILIVLSVTIILIRNSFQISIAERKKEFGTLISIGATSKQIRKIVLIEGVIYALISIPIGLILGIGMLFLSTNTIGNVLENMFGNNWSMQCSINSISILVTISLVILSIIISCIKPIKESKKISPIEMIKKNNEIATKNKEIKISKWKSKILGIEGQIAYKNIKRNKRKYCSTTISISVIMLLVILGSSMVQYVFTIVNDIYQPTNRNLDIATIGRYDGQEEKTSTVFRIYDRIKRLDNVMDYSIRGYFSGQSISIVFYEGRIYENYLKILGLKYDDTSRAGILLSVKPSLEEGEILDIIVNEKKYKIPIIKTTSIDPDAAISDIDDSKMEKYKLDYEKLIISNDMAKEIYDDDEKDNSFRMEMKINSSSPNELEKEISQFVNLGKISISNYTKQKEDAQRFSLIMSIFLYGLLLVIFLIGITNIYNTITASIYLRKREFETLIAIGMSNKQFSKMFFYESLIYGLKSIIIGIALGIVLSYGIYFIIKTNQELEYYFPYVQTLIMVGLNIMVIYISTKIAWKNYKIN